MRLPRRIRWRIAAVVAAIPGAVSAQTVPLEVTRLTTIGCDACGDARELARISDLSVASDGTVLVAGPDTPNLRLFARDGRPLRQMGRQGSGPGEHRFPMRASFGPNGSFSVLDMSLRRVAHLGPDGTEIRSMRLSAFPGAVASRGGSGELVVLTDDFRGNLTVFRYPPDGSDPTTLTKIAKPAALDGHLSFPVIAVSPDGELAVALTGEAYRITRLAPGGQSLPDIARDIARVRRTPEEIAELTKRRERAQARVRTELGRAGGSGRGPDLRGPEETLKPHFVIDGLRYDQRGRLWVLTMRGSPREAIFDVFSGAGAYLGSLRVPSDVQGFALGGDYLVTHGANDDGVPIVELWSVTAK
jgi:hypothetical protein